MVGWKREEISHLIELYKEENVLYDFKHDYYFCRNMRTEAVERIVSVLNKNRSTELSVEEVRRKIKTLRSQYSFEKNEVDRSISIDPENVHKPTLWCYDQLSFLEKFTRKRKLESLLESFPPDDPEPKVESTTVYIPSENAQQLKASYPQESNVEGTTFYIPIQSAQQLTNPQESKVETATVYIPIESAQLAQKLNSTYSEESQVERPTFYIRTPEGLQPLQTAYPEGILIEQRNEQKEASVSVKREISSPEILEEEVSQTGELSSTETLEGEAPQMRELSSPEDDETSERRQLRCHKMLVKKIAKDSEFTKSTSWKEDRCDVFGQYVASEMKVITDEGLYLETKCAIEGIIADAQRRMLYINKNISFE